MKHKWIVILSVVCFLLCGCGGLLTVQEDTFPEEIVLYGAEPEGTPDREVYTAAETQQADMNPNNEVVEETEPIPETTPEAEPIPETTPEAEPMPETTPEKTPENASETAAVLSDEAENTMQSEAGDSSSKNQVTVPDAEEEGENLVWVPVNGGTKYHKSASCSKMKNPMQVTCDTAIANGYEPCKRCYGK